MPECFNVCALFKKVYSASERSVSEADSQVVSTEMLEICQ